MSSDYRANRDSSAPKGDIHSEVGRLIANSDNHSDYTILAKLRSKFNNDEDMVQAVFDGYKKKQEHIHKKAQKFRNLMLTKYMNKNMTFDDLLAKARKYKKKYELSDSEFQLFLNLALTDKSRQYKNVLMAPNTAMSRILGQDPTGLSGKLNVKEKELAVLQEILKMHGETRPLHAQVVLQSLTYQGFAPEALMGKFDSRKHNAFDCIHPVLAALFLPRIGYLDEHVLIANLANIIKCKYEGIPISTQPDYELYWDLITDPNNTVCDMSSPIRDLRNRVLLQCKIWENVLNLRQGRYYNSPQGDFMLAVDNCKHNFFDTPDLEYVKDEGTIFRRLISCFSIRPTIVTTSPIYGIVSHNPHVPSSANVQVTTIPMITFRLPVTFRTMITRSAYHLEDSLHQAQHFVENKMLVPKAQSIIYSKEVLFFYVTRRYHDLNVVQQNAPYVFTKLPKTLTGLEKLNDQPVNFSYNMSVGSEMYELRSVLFVNQTKAGDVKIITGSSAGCIMPANPRDGRPTEQCCLYDPQSVQKTSPDTTTGMPVLPEPVTWIPKTHSIPRGLGREVMSFHERAVHNGTVFMYVQRH